MRLKSFNEKCSSLTQSGEKNGGFLKTYVELQFKGVQNKIVRRLAENKA